jgi:hypothetical protein
LWHAYVTAFACRLMLDAGREREFGFLEMLQETRNCKDVTNSVRNPACTEASNILNMIAYSLQQRALELGKNFRMRSADCHGEVPLADVVCLPVLSLSPCMPPNVSHRMLKLLSSPKFSFLQLDLIHELVPASKPNHRYIIAKQFIIDSSKVEYMSIADLRNLCRKITMEHSGTKVCTFTVFQPAVQLLTYLAQLASFQHLVCRSRSALQKLKAQGMLPPIIFAGCLHHTCQCFCNHLRMVISCAGS